jgi:predicted P-loop ATPase
MAERFSEMEKGSVPSKATWEERVKQYPELMAKIETMFGIIENAGGDIEKAAEAERRIIEELREVGNGVLHGWARRQQEKKEQESNAQPGVNRTNNDGYLSEAFQDDEMKHLASGEWREDSPGRPCCLQHRFDHQSIPA